MRLVLGQVQVDIARLTQVCVAGKLQHKPLERYYLTLLFPTMYSEQGYLPSVYLHLPAYVGAAYLDRHLPPT